MNNEGYIWNYLTTKGFSPEAVAGILGNLYAESALKSTNLQSTGNKQLCLTDEAYTDLVDAGEYSNFANDGYGYGLAQWTFHTRKASLLKASQKQNVSIGDLDFQLDFFVKEISGYTNVKNVLTNAKTVEECCDIVLTGYEKPKDQSEKAKEKRRNYARNYYEKYSKKKEKTVIRLALEVIKGLWGVNPERKERLTNDGYDYMLVQTAVNEIINEWRDINNG